MLRRPLSVLVGLLAVLVMVAPRHAADAVSGATTDPAEAPSGTEGSLPIDIVRVTHDDSPTTITYTLQSATDFTDDVLNAHWVEWNITLDDANSALIDAGADGPAFSCNGDAPVGTVTVTRESSGTPGSTPANSIKVTFARSLLTDCGLTGDSYLYYTDVVHPTADTGDDAVPDDGNITHDLDADSGTGGTTTTTGAGGGSTTSTTAAGGGGSTTSTTTGGGGGSTTSTTAAGGGGTTTTTTADPGGTTTTTAAPATTTTTAGDGGTTTTTSAAAPSQSTATVDDSTPTPGQQVRFTGGGFGANKTLDATFNSDPVSLGQVQSDAQGNVAATFTVPANAAPGSHTIVVSGPGPNGEAHSAVAGVTVVSGQGLPRTGADSQRWLLAGLLVLAAAVLARRPASASR